MVICLDLKKMTGYKGQHNPVSSDKPVPDPSMPISDSKVRVLVVDDDEKILRFLHSSIRLAGYDVMTANCGEEALQLIESGKPQCMVLDMLMPAMDGFEVLKRLRSTSEMPVIAVSAHADNAGQALSLGANVFLAKPFRPDKLIKKIRAIVP